MKPTSVAFAMALFSSGWLVVVLVGCSSSQTDRLGTEEIWSAPPQASEIGERQWAPLLARVSQLHVVAQDALEASKMVGTSDSDLKEAQQLLAQGEHSLQQAKTLQVARQYKASWEQLRAADMAFRHSEEIAVRAGLGQLERELLANYGRPLTAELANHRSPSTLRVNQGNVNLRDGAGVNFHIVGKVQLGDTLILLAESGEWYRVRAATGIVGWVAKSLVTRVSLP